MWNFPNSPIYPNTLKDSIYYIILYYINNNVEYVEYYNKHYTSQGYNWGI